MFSVKKFLLVLLAMSLVLLSACSNGSDTTTAPSQSNLPSNPWATNPTETPGASSANPTTAPRETTTGRPTVTAPVTTEAPTTEAPPPDYAFEPTASGIYVTRDGGIKSAEITPFDNSGFAQERYKEEDLKTFVADSVKEYNDAKGTEAVKIEELSVQDKVAKLILGYESFNYFLDFQGSDFGVKYLTVMSKENAIRNYDLMDLKDASGAPVDLLVALERDDIKVLIMTGHSLVTLNGDILYLSQGMTYNDTNSAYCEDDENYSFIIFR